MQFLERLKPCAPAVVRLAIALVFLWFGVSQLLTPEDFMGYLPSFLLTTEYAQTLVVLNGIAEIILSALLAIGLFTRPAAALLAVHLLAIVISLGYNDIAVRDAGLLLITISILIGGADTWTLDYRRTQR